MKRIYFNLTEQGHCDGVSFNDNGHENSLEVEETHEVLRLPHIYKFIDGELIKDSAYQQKLIERDNQPSELERLKQENEMNAIAIMELAQIMMGGK